MSVELKPCPFCGWRATVSKREMRFYGQNDFGAKKIKFAAYGMCNRCKAKGPTITDIIITGRCDTNDYFRELENRAVEAWNRRAKDE